jgi:hypothetical protein
MLINIADGIQYSRAEILNESGGFINAAPTQDAIFNQTSGRRDRDRKVVGNYLLELVRKSHLFVVSLCLLKFVSDSLTTKTNGHFPWGKWCEFAFDNKLMLIGWSRRHVAPGPGFSYRNSISSEGWKDLIGRVPAIWRNNPLRDPNLPELDIIPWSDSMLSFHMHVLSD